MTASVRYYVEYGPGEGSEWYDAEVELTEEEEELYNEAMENGTPLDDVSGLDDVLSRAWDEIAEQEIENALDMDDSYAAECTGREPMDTAELNDLVHARDPHALAFFGLNNLSDDEIEDWDADDLDDIPDICDFVEGFKAINPFHEGWTLTVEFADSDEYDEYDDEDEYEDDEEED